MSIHQEAGRRGGQVSTPRRGENLVTLSPRQRDALTAMVRHQREHGSYPSYRELMAELGLKSSNHIHELTKALERKGWIRRMPRKHRSFQVLRVPEGV